MTVFSRFLCAFAALFCSTAAFASTADWTISDADGQVTVTRDSKPIYGATGTVLKTGDVVTTSKTARAVLVREGKFVVVEPGKKVRIAKTKEKGAVSKIFEYLGSMVSTTSPRNSFGKQTAAAVVKGYGSGVEKSLSSSNSATYNTDTNQDDPANWQEVEPQTL